MKKVQHIRRHASARRLAVIRPMRMERNSVSLREALDAPIQTKLKVGAPDDAFEREADGVADRVMGMPEARLQRQTSDEPLMEEEKQTPVRTADDREEEVQRKAIETTGDPTITSANLGAAGGGQPLPKGERAFFEPRLGTDLDTVRVHTDTEADRLATGLSARAFTLGRDIYFGAGEYRPGYTQGRQLIAHELAHVLQQGKGEENLRRKIDRVKIKRKGIDVYFSLGIYGPNASANLASAWATNIENKWSQQLKIKGMTIDAKVHVTAKAYPHIPDVDMMQLAISESNAVYVEKNGFRSHVAYSGWGHDHWSTGRWAVNADPLVVAHETGHMMGLQDKYVDIPFLGSVDLPGYEKDIMANFWNDNGKTDFTRGWCGILLYHFFGYRT
ncbi:MAG: DUF4157 domain-containing protein [Desulfobulbus sp.]